jgi:hypothetical protein
MIADPASAITVMLIGQSVSALGTVKILEVTFIPFQQYHLQYITTN